jgi:hypothetical protein
LNKKCEDFLLLCNITCIINAPPVVIDWELQQKPDRGINQKQKIFADGQYEKNH